MAENKEPMSLNQRHSRLLKDLSEPTYRQSPMFQLFPDETEKPFKVKLEGRRRLCKTALQDSNVIDDEDDAPTFSGITDFDSPPKEEIPENMENVVCEGWRPLCKDSSTVDDANLESKFSEISNFNSPCVAKNLNACDSGSANEIRSILNDLNSKLGCLSIEKPNPKKVDSFENPSLGLLRVEDRDEHKTIDLSTSPYSKLDDGSHYMARNNVETKVEMCDDRENLTSHSMDDSFVMMSKAQIASSKSHIKNGTRMGYVKKETMDQPLIYKEKVEKDDDTSVVLHNKGSISGVFKGEDRQYSKLNESKVEGYDDQENFTSYSRDDSFVMMNKAQIDTSKRHIENGTRMGYVKNGALEQPPVYNVEEEVEEDDDTNVIWRNKGSISGVFKGADRQYNKPNKPKVEVYDDRENFASHSTDDSFVMMSKAQIATSKRHIENGTRMSYVKNGAMGQPLVYNVEEEVEDDGTSVILSNKGTINGVFKGADKQYSKLNGELGSSSVVDAFGDEYVDNSVSEDRPFFTMCDPKSTFNLHSKLVKMLYPHQREGLKWLWSLHCQGKGGILGDDMGLGKTMQICAFLAGLFQSCLVKRVLIVAPKTLLSHWIKELSTVGLSEKIKEYYGTCARARQYELQYVLQDKGVLLTTYDIVRNNSKSLCGDSKYIDVDEVTWDYMILDEGHLIKNPSTQRAKSLLEIPSAHRIIISGTPIQNNLKELWALFHFCCPGLLHDKNWFKEKYEYKILRGNDKHASDREKRIGSQTAKELRDRIQPYFLRRLKSEVFLEDAESSKISKKDEIIVWLKLTSCQRQLYEAFLKSELVLSAFDGSPLAALTIMKKICDHPLLLTKRAAEDVLEGMDSMLNQEDMGVAEKLATHLAETEGENFQEMHDNVSCKLSFIMSLLGYLIPKGHNVLIFSQTRKMLNLIQESLISNDFRFLRIDGTTKASDRMNIVNNFQEGVGAPIFLLTSQVGGLGLTLTKADRVIVVDPAWNPSTDNQSVDRAYRIGQMKDVLVYRLMTCGTVEEKIYKKQIYKGGLFKTATEQKEQTRYFGQQDLKELFSLPKQGFDVSLTQQQLHEEHDSQYAMNDFLKEHIRFLESKGIAGVSHHSLLFSKTAPTPITEEEEREKMIETTSTSRMFMPSKTSHERVVDGDVYALNPKEADLCPKNSAVNTAPLPTESNLKKKISRLTQILGDKGTISKLPDKGARIQLQIAELYSELEKLKSVRETIDLVDVTEELERKFAL